MSKRYSVQEKLRFVQLYKTTYSAHEICEKYGMSRSTLLLWVQQYSEVPTKVKTVREVYLLEKEVARLRTENQIYKLSGCTTTSSIEQKVTAIERLKDSFSIHALCETLQLNRSTYYHRALRSPEQTQTERTDEIIRPLIAKIFDKSGHRFGARKIKIKLSEEGYTISERRIHRLMKEMNLSIKSTYTYPNATFCREYKYYSNKLKQHFLQEAPNMVWVSDMTCVKVTNEVYWLCVIIDLYSRKVISYGVSDSADTEFLLSVFQNAYHSRNKPENLMFHSDQGTQYASYKFRSYLRSIKVKQSFSRTGTPYDNAVAESFFASIKKEEFKRCYYENAKELNESVNNYIKFFNEYRPHQRLGQKTPNHVEKDYYERIK